MNKRTMDRNKFVEDTNLELKQVRSTVPLYKVIEEQEKEKEDDALK